MKKNNYSILLLITCFVMTGFFSSCNKKLKDDIKKQDEEVAALKALQEANSAANATNAANLNGVSAMIGYNSPFSMSLTTKNTADSVIKENKTYRYYTGGDYCYMQPNGVGTWYVELSVSEIPNWNREAYLSCTYNPTTKVVTNARVNLNYYDYTYSYKNPRLDQNDTETTATFTFAPSILQQEQLTSLLMVLLQTFLVIIFIQEKE